MLALVGGGFLIVPALVLLRGLRIHQAIGTSLLIIYREGSALLSPVSAEQAATYLKIPLNLF